MLQRFHKASLAVPPEVRTCGAFADSSTRQDWVQPRDLWQGLLFRHKGMFHWNGQSLPIEENDLFIVPPSSRCAVERSGADSYVYSYFGFAPHPGDRDVVSLPLKTNLGSHGNFWDIEFRKCLNRVQLTRTSAHAIVVSILWSVAQPEHVANKSPYVERATEIITTRIHERIRLGALADELHVSLSHLNRLFLSEMGMTPSQFVLSRKAELAHSLLTKSTLPIKQVAASCGVPNLHHFNRFVRDRFGVSPRTLRMSLGNVDLYRVAHYSEESSQDIKPK